MTDAPPTDLPTDLDELDQYLGPLNPARAAWCHFDAEWYLQAYPDVRAELDGADFAGVRAHYLAFGRPAGLSPNMFFDEAWYLLRYPAVAAEVAAGLVACGYEHYCAIGFLTHTPHWLYDEALYAAHATDVSEAALAEAGCYNRYDHYLKAGAREARIAHLLFDPAIYLAGQQAPRLDWGGAFAHFLRQAWFARRDAVTSPYFDPAWFRASYPDLGREIDAGRYACALHAYLAQPGPPWRNPLPQFSEAFYREATPEAAAAIAAGTLHTGYEHFLKHGVQALRPPAPGHDLTAFLRANPAAAQAVETGALRDAFLALLQHAAPAPDPLPAPTPTPAPPPPPTPAPPPPAPAISGQGHLERFGHHASAHGWMFSGWITPPPADPQGLRAVIRFAASRIEAEAILVTFPRGDLGDLGAGLLAFVPGAATGTPPLGLDLSGPAGTWALAPLPDTQPLHDQDLSAAMQPVLASLPPGPARDRLTQLAARHLFTGASTLPSLRDRIFLEMEEAIICPPDGLTLIGWVLATPGALAHIRLQSGTRSTELVLADCIRHDRPDVRDSVGAKHGLTSELRTGFIAHLAHAYLPEATSYLEVETTSGEIAHRGINQPRLREMEAIRYLVDRVHVRYGDIPPAFDHVLGPSIASLNAARLQTRPQVSEIAFGPQPAAPEVTVIVTLYGRLDFMDYQFGLLSRHQPAIAVEYIYVLDDPAQRWEAENLAASLYQRFRIPLRLLVLDRNMGYAPANNIGLAAAHAPHVCFMNSDVFAATPDWLERLLARLAADPGLGAVGPLLLFEDGCVQHQGMQFERIPAMGDFHFPIHTRKGWRPPPEGGLRPAAAITGACLLMRTDLARELGGFDEAYIIGDFEDADLCLKLRARGLSCAVDLDARLYHLERQSQVGPENRWRMNITLFNAWLHERRWAATLAELDAEPPAPAIPA